MMGMKTGRGGGEVEKSDAKVCAHVKVRNMGGGAGEGGGVVKPEWRGKYSKYVELVDGDEQ